MKVFLIILSLLLSVSLFSVEKVELNDKELTVYSDKVILVRTSDSPRKVKLNMQIPITKMQCVEYDTIMVWGQNASHCGTQTVIKYEWQYFTVCTKVVNGKCVESYQEKKWVPVQHQEANFCHYPVTVCTKSAPVTHSTSDRVSVVFKNNLPKLAAGEVEEFELKGMQNDGGFWDNVTYSLTAKKTVFEYEIDPSSTIDRFVIRKK